MQAQKKNNVENKTEIASSFVSELKTLKWPFNEEIEIKKIEETKKPLIEQKYWLSQSQKAIWESAKGEHWPSIDLNLQYRDSLAKDQSKSQLLGLVTLTLPIWNQYETSAKISTSYAQYFSALNILKLFNGKNSDQIVKVKDLKETIPGDQKAEFDFETMDTIIKLNECECWGLDKVINAVKNGGPLSKEELHNKGEYRSALWLILSMMNHSCCPNTIRFSIEDYIFLIAKVNISKGEEICTTYIPTTTPYEIK